MRMRAECIDGVVGIRVPGDAFVCGRTYGVDACEEVGYGGEGEEEVCVLHDGTVRVSESIYVV